MSDAITFRIERDAHDPAKVACLIVDPTSTPPNAVLGRGVAKTPEKARALAERLARIVAGWGGDELAVPGRRRVPGEVG